MVDMNFSLVFLQKYNILPLTLTIYGYLHYQSHWLGTEYSASVNSKLQTQGGDSGQTAGEFGTGFQLDNPLRHMGQEKQSHVPTIVTNVPRMRIVHRSFFLHFDLSIKY